MPFGNTAKPRPALTAAILPDKAASVAAHYGSISAATCHPFRLSHVTQPACRRLAMPLIMNRIQTVATFAAS